MSFKHFRDVYGPQGKSCLNNAKLASPTNFPQHICIYKIGATFYTDMNGFLRMDCNNFGDFFKLCHPQLNILICSVLVY